MLAKHFPGTATHFIPILFYSISFLFTQVNGWANVQRHISKRLGLMFMVECNLYCAKPTMNGNSSRWLNFLQSSWQPGEKIMNMTFRYLRRHDKHILYIYIYICMHASIHPSIHPSIHTHTHIHTYIHTYIFVYSKYVLSHADDVATHPYEISILGHMDESLAHLYGTHRSQFIVRRSIILCTTTCDINY